MTLLLIRVRRNHIERLQAVHQTPTVHISNCLWTNRLCVCLVIKKGKTEGTGETSHELQIKADPFKITHATDIAKQMTIYQRASEFT